MDESPDYLTGKSATRPGFESSGKSVLTELKPRLPVKHLGHYMLESDKVWNAVVATVKHGSYDDKTDASVTKRSRNEASSSRSFI